MSWNFLKIIYIFPGIYSSGIFHSWNFPLLEFCPGTFCSWNLISRNFLVTKARMKYIGFTITIIKYLPFFVSWYQYLEKGNFIITFSIHSSFITSKTKIYKLPAAWFSQRNFRRISKYIKRISKKILRIFSSNIEVCFWIFDFFFEKFEIWKFKFFEIEFIWLLGIFWKFDLYEKPKLLKSLKYLIIWIFWMNKLIKPKPAKKSKSLMKMNQSFFVTKLVIEEDKHRYFW